MTQAEMQAAFEAALESKKDLFTSAMGSTNSSSSNSSTSDDFSSNFEGMTPEQKQEAVGKNVESSMQNLAKYGIDAASGVGAAIKEQLTLLYKHQADKSDEAQQRLEYFYDARDQLGGIAIVPEKGMERMGKLAKIVLEGYEDVLVSATAGVESGLKFADGTMQGMDPLVSFFKDADAAAKKFGEVINAIGTDTPVALTKMNKQSMKELTFFAETLKLTDQQMSDLVKRQYAFTGEANADVMGDIANVAKALEVETGLTANALKEDILKITTDIDRFGNIGVDSAGRISAALGQLGVDFESFSRLTDSFMDFDSAANKMGELSALFGVQMDAMEMTYLANEDQEEFLFRMREEIMDAGIDVENMSNTRARALASQLNMSVAEMKTFLREGELAVDQMDMAGATDATEAMDGLTTAGKYFGDQFARDMKNPQQVIEEALIPSLVKNRNVLIENRNATEQFNQQLQAIKLPDQIADIQAEAINFDTFSTDLKRGAAKATIDTINDYGQKFGDMLDETLQEFKDARIEKQKELTAFLEDNTGFDATRVEDFRNLSTDYLEDIKLEKDDHIDQLRKLSEEDTKQKAVDRGQVETALEQMGITGGKLERLVNQLEAGAVVQINVDMNADKVADTMFQIHKKNGHFAVANANKP